MESKTHIIIMIIVKLKFVFNLKKKTFVTHIKYQMLFNFNHKS